MFQQVSKPKAKANPTLQPWEQQLAHALLFNDNGVLLQFNKVPDISTGDITPWVKQLVELDMVQVACGSGGT